MMAIGSIDRRGQRIAAVLAALVQMSASAMAQQASQAQQNAIREACPADYRANCANVPAAGQAAFACLARNLARLSPACQRAVSSVSTRAAPPAASSSSTAAAPTAAPYAGSAASSAPMTMRQELMILRQSCGADFRALCSGVPLGGGRAVACLRANATSLSPQCGQALSAARGNQ
ncbi:MAG TPA: hypothetical protein VGI28_13655 [Stellaceae bacterium]|jgi:hypothetical protein